MSWRRFLLPAVSICAVAVVTAWEFASSRTGPGPLHSAHHELDGLFGSDCSSCHEAGAGISVKGCVTCHEAIGKQREQKRGLHGRMQDAQYADCGQCHSEHHGEASVLIAPQAFLYAGVQNPMAYDHRHVPDYRLVGAHAVLDCDQCHPAAQAKTPPKGGRFLGLQQACATCHEDVHRGNFGSDCEKCHGQVEKFPAAPGFEHDVFPLVDAHAEVACDKCHAPGTERSTESLAKKPQPTRKCAECHEDPHHQNGATPAKAILLKDTADCSKCHTSTKFANARVTPAKHAEFGFPLRGGHAKAECAKCHGDGKNESKHGDPLPPLEACARCHESPHQKEFVAAAVAIQGPADGCASCHVDEHADFHVATTTPAQHAVTGFALDVPHAQLDCAKCHPKDGESFAARFPGRRAEDCRACHEDVHKGQFDGETRYAQCTACHQKTAFVPTAFGSAMHAKTKFPLTGAHDAVACANCHDVVLSGVRTFHGTSTKCADCHRDVHRGEFDKEGKPKVVQGREGCARCHDTTAFSPVRAQTFDHGLWTGYRLDGAHAKVECGKCHPPTANGSVPALESVASTGSRRLGAPAGKHCVDCHRDQHQGQFGVGKSIDCARCHDATDFEKPHFDHDHDSRFPLDAQHASLKCESCHKTYESAAGPVVRYKPLGVECGDCHRLGNKHRREQR